METTKPCVACGAEKLLGEFHVNRRRHDGRQKECKACKSERHRRKREDPAWVDENRRRQREGYRRRRAADPDRFRGAQLKRLYGISVEEYADMREAQGHRCAACRDPLVGGKDEHLDHSHATGAVRGILCRHCNAALGWARDSVDVLRSLIGYLDR